MLWRQTARSPGHWPAPSLRARAWWSRHSKRALCTACASPASPIAALQQAPDLILRHRDTGVAVAVFGVYHIAVEPRAGDWILGHRPKAVIVETACNSLHGGEPGNLVSCADPMDGPSAYFQRMFCQVAASLKEQGAAALELGGLWSQVQTHLNGEQLAYVAAFATDALLVFGDRPKHITYARLWEVPSLTELDEGYGLQAAANYHQYLAEVAQGGGPAAAGSKLHTASPGAAAAAAASAAAAGAGASSSYDPNNLHVVDRIMMLEREAVMCQVVAETCQSLSAGREAGAAGAAAPQAALVVGSAHLPGLKHLWEEEAWQEVVGAGSLAGSPLMQPTRVALKAMHAPGAGVKRGLLDGLMRLSVPGEVAEDMARELPALPDHHADAASWAREIYSSPRMQLASLPKPLLQQVCSSAPGTPDMWDALAPLRALRPVHGGPGWCPELGQELRELNFDVA